ncbi:MAG: zf-HC2 domain-containing protein [Candidatus Eisenbacteria bacterium]|uniref:Zf-HC2 domain-containing protein n=1 Tax=Eiseniibacteriota bacterium TaxID=2212470 RepID=A0A9D6L7C1_UNCEI|nr:zf-HC2 domain-containing protein [Candidatus Eisenbacteria bacterium]MBI3540101.1 zf-HC2 domain-containing protein [Candidatus Eisenbacteria bacterium]
MKRCPETDRIEAWLDGDLPPAASLVIEAHLAGCRDCAREAASLRRLFAHLAVSPARDPGPRLTERILDRVAPSRVRRRQVTVLGWCYTAVSAVSTFAFISWIIRPETPATLGRLVGGAYSQLIRVGLFTLEAVTSSALRLHHGLGVLGTMAGWILPALRALASLGGDPWFAGTLWASFAASATLLVWMRPRPVRIVRRDRHVGILGF